MDNISYVAIGRIRDQAILGGVGEGLTPPQKDEIDSVMRQILYDSVSCFPAGSRQKRILARGEMYFYLDKTLTCVYAVALCTMGYSERLAYDFLLEIVDLVGKQESASNLKACNEGSLTKSIRKPLLAIMQKYDHPEKFDKTMQVQGKVNDVREIMDENVNRILQNNSNLENLQAKSENLAQSAVTFNKGATQMRDAMWRQKMKVTAMLGIIITAVIVYVIVILVGTGE